MSKRYCIFCNDTGCMKCNLKRRVESLEKLLLEAQKYIKILETNLPKSTMRRLNIQLNKTKDQK